MKLIQKVTPQEQKALQAVLKEEGAEAVVRYVIAINPPVPVSTTEASEWLIQLGILKKNPFEKEDEVVNETSEYNKETSEEVEKAEAGEKEEEESEEDKDTEYDGPDTVKENLDVPDPDPEADNKKE